MINVLYNALHLTGLFSGVQNTVEQLFEEAFRHTDTNISMETLCPYNYLPNVPIPLSQRLTKIGINSHNRLQRISYEHFFMKYYFKKKNKDILHCPAYILPLNWKDKSIITVHDIIALKFPEYCSTENYLYFNFFLPRSIQNATKIIAVSHTVKNDILQKFNIDSEKIKVIYPGINDIFRTSPSLEKLAEVKKKYHLPQKFILYVGNIEPKKNIVRLIKSFENLVRHSETPHSLVIAGKFAWKYKDVLKEFRRQDSNRIFFPGYISQSDLPALYSLADLFVFPSLYEGFGIPPLEAMASNTPVVCSTGGALSEIAGTSAYIVDPLSIDSITKGMKDVLQDSNLRNQLLNKGKQYVKQFTWAKTWSNTVNLYSSLSNT
jgi:glycosyltransferase involved in cell wall biosynthesis